MKFPWCLMNGCGRPAFWIQKIFGRGIDRGQEAGFAVAAREVYKLDEQRRVR